MTDVRVRVREGCRGGQEQFRWGSLKEQAFKDREQYLGASTKVGMQSKFGRYYVHDWYARKRDTAESIDEERQTVQLYEEELMQEALGLKPKKLLLAKTKVGEDELKELLRKERMGEKGRQAMGPQGHESTDDLGNVVEAEVDRGNLIGEASSKGLGFAAHRNTKLEEFKADALGTEAKLEGSKSLKQSILDKYKPDGMQMKTEVKIEESEVKRQAKEEKHEPSAKREPNEVKEEVKEELIDEPAPKRRKEEQHSDEKRPKKVKKEKKEKKTKKLKKEEKKAAKKAKKAMKKAKKAAKKVAGKSTSSTDSSSS